MTECDIAAQPINHELRRHAEDPRLSDAQFRILYLLSTDQSRDSKNVVLVKQIDLAFWTNSTRETVRNRIVAMPGLVTKKTYQVKIDHRLCSYTLHLNKTMADSAVTLSESTNCQTVTDFAALRGSDVTDRAVFYSNKKDSNEHERQINNKNQSVFEKSNYTEMTAESAIVSDDEPEPKPALPYDDELSRLFGI